MSVPTMLWVGVGVSQPRAVLYCPCCPPRPAARDGAIDSVRGWDATGRGGMEWNGMGWDAKTGEEREDTEHFDTYSTV